MTLPVSAVARSLSNPAGNLIRINSSTEMASIESVTLEVPDDRTGSSSTAMPTLHRPGRVASEAASA